MRLLFIILSLSALTATSAPSLESRVTELTLSNGMVFLLVERHDAPVFTGFVRLRVGGIDEEQGFTGLAHLFEHMAFKGTPRLGTKDWPQEQALLLEIERVGDALAKLERAGTASSEQGVALKAELKALSIRHKALTDENALAQLYQVNGGVGLNATTDKDLTSYFVSLPKNRLELWATVEAQRLSAPVLRDFYTERDVVQEERLRSIESNPGGVLFEELNQLAFGSNPYRWSTVGYQKDLAAMTLGKALDFHRRFYAPANAVGCLVGDFETAQLKPLLERTFGAVPARPRPAEPVFTDPPLRAQRRAHVTFDANPRLAIAVRRPPPPSKDDFVFDVLEVLLSEGRTGRLQQRLVFKDRLAQGVGVFSAPGVRAENLFIVSVVPMSGVKNEDVERAVWEELEKLETTPPTVEELEKVRNRLTADFARSIDSNAGLASALSRYQTLFDDWRYAVRLPQEIAAITPADVQRVASQYFDQKKSVVVTLGKEGGAR